MSARKLQQEIDKVNKKISEGLAIFDDTYEKLFATELSTQRDKFEADLKKEIKKLQRLRDQVKQWLGDGSIKLDKKVLQDNRSKIEHAMDQFKDLEKLSKIKQFSNEGLELLSKLSGKLKRFGDSNDAKKQEACEYISEVIEKLSAQNEILEGEIHQYATQLKKAKSSNAYSIQASLDEVKEKHDQIDNHLEKLESVLRSLENEILKPDQVDTIKDDLDYIVESNQDEDFIDYDDFYDVLNLEEIEFNAFNKEEQDRKEKEEREEQERLEKEQKEKEQKEQKESEQKEKEKKDKELKEKEEAEKKKQKITTPVVTASTIKKAVVNPSVPPPLAAGSYSSVLKNALNESNNSQNTLTPTSNSTGSTPVVPNVYESGKTIAETVASATATSGTGVNASPISVAANGTNPVESKIPPPGLNGLSRVNTAKSSTASPISVNIPIPQTESIESYESKTFLDNIPRLCQISEHRLNNPLPFKSISNLLQNSLYNCPDSFDAEKPRQYNPKTVHPSSIDYPQEPMLELQSRNIMKKFNDDTLFYCFYYSDGIYNLSRYNAAVELTRRGWVFNKETRQWFQQDNKSDDLKYFDYQETWLIRRKDVKLNEQLIQKFM